MNVSFFYCSWILYQTLKYLQLLRLFFENSPMYSSRLLWVYFLSLSFSLSFSISFISAVIFIFTFLLLALVPVCSFLLSQVVKLVYWLEIFLVFPCVYSCKISCLFLLYRKVTQLCIYIHSLSHITFHYGLSTYF